MEANTMQKAIKLLYRIILFQAEKVADIGVKQSIFRMDMHFNFAQNLSLGERNEPFTGRLSIFLVLYSGWLGLSAKILLIFLRLANNYKIRNRETENSAGKQ